MSIGFSPVNPSSELVCNVTLILWSSNFGLELINLLYTSVKTSLENTDNPSCDPASESSQIEYIVLFSSIKFSEISLAPTVMFIISLSAPSGDLDIISQPFSEMIFRYTVSLKATLEYAVGSSIIWVRS